MKHCPKCDEVKTFAEFNNSSFTTDGKNRWCRRCTIKAGKEQREKHGADRRAKNRKSSLKRKYGLSFEAYMDILEKQGYLCAICKCGPSDPSNAFCVDHCHKTGKIRGVLCRKCNLGIGNFGEQESTLTLATAYLKQYNG